MVSLRSAVHNLTAALRRRVLLLIGHAVLNLAEDSTRLQVVQISGLDGETRDGVPHYFDYGFTSHPHPGADVVLACVGGNRHQGIAIKIDDRRFRLTSLAPGEVAIYDDLGQKVHLKRNGIVAESPLNIYMKTDGVLRLEGNKVEIHGKAYVQTDVGGHGERKTNTGGANYHDDTWTTGTVFDAPTEHGIDQAHVPSEHPEGP